MVRITLLEGLAATDRFHGKLRRELRTVGSSLSHHWVGSDKSKIPPQRLTMDPVQKKPDHLTHSCTRTFKTNESSKPLTLPVLARESLS